ncbi:MAK10-like protein [Tanacetum coccineum]
MGDENPIHTLRDYSKLSHEGYKNTIKLPVGNNMVPLRSDTIQLVQNGCSFHGLWSEDPNQHLKDFLKLVDSLDLDGENRERTRLRLFQFALRDQASNWLERLPAGSISTWEDLNTRFLAQFFLLGRITKLQKDILMFQQHHEESLSDAWTRFKDLLQKVPHHGIDLWLQALLEDLVLYDNESWNDPRDFAKPVKAIVLPQDVPSTFDHHLIELENQETAMAHKSIAAISHDEREELRKKGIKSPSKLTRQSGMIWKQNMEVEDVIEEEESEFKTDEEVEEIFKEEEEDEDDENFNSFPTMKELSHHEWLLKNLCPLWVKAKVRAQKHEPPTNISSMSSHLQKTMLQKSSNPDKISNFVGRVRRLKVFIGSFSHECEFMILEDTTSIIDRYLGEFFFEKPFIDETGLVYNKEKGTVMFEQDDEKIAFKMPYTMEIFKQTKLMGLSTDSIPPSAHEENIGHGRTHYYQSLLIGDEYKQNGGDGRGIRHLMRLYLMRRSLEVLRKFYWMILGGRFNQLSHVSSPLLSKPGEY